MTQHSLQKIPRREPGHVKPYMGSLPCGSDFETTLTCAKKNNAAHLKAPARQHQHEDLEALARYGCVFFFTKYAQVTSPTCGALFSARTTPQPSVEPSWNPRGTLLEPYLGPPRTTPEPIWAETPKLSAVGGKNKKRGRGVEKC